MSDDAQLLRRFVSENAQDAFAELVRRRVNLIYTAALRQVGGDTHLAQDVTQGVFVALAQSARSLMDRPVLTGWLYTTTRFVAAKLVRERQRRTAREQEAHIMRELTNAAPPEPRWEELRPVLDAAMYELGERDREAVLLRCFEGRPFGEIAAICGLSENAARMRVERALEKLRVRLAARHITSSAAALGAVLAQQTVSAAPAAVVVAATAAGTAVTTAGGPATLLMAFTTSQKLTAAALVVLVGTGISLFTSTRLDAHLAEEAQQQTAELGRLRLEGQTLQAEARLLSETAASRTPAPVADPLARAHAVAALLKEGSIGRITWIARQPLDVAQVPAALRDLFVLTPDETVALQGAIATAQREITAQGMAHAEVVRNGNSVSIYVKPGAEEAASYQRLRDSFSQTLGPERLALHDEIGWGESIKNSLNNLGMVPELITVTREPMPREPENPFSFSRTRGLVPTGGGVPAPSGGGVPVPGGRGVPAPSGGGIGARGTASPESLKEMLGPLSALVPPDL